MNRQEYFFIEILIGLGFLSGMWLAIGVDPESAVYSVILDLIKDSDLKFWIVYLFRCSHMWNYLFDIRGL